MRLKCHDKSACGIFDSDDKSVSRGVHSQSRRSRPHDLQRAGNSSSGSDTGNSIDVHLNILGWVYDRLAHKQNGVAWPTGFSRAHHVRSRRKETHERHRPECRACVRHRQPGASQGQGRPHGRTCGCGGRKAPPPSPTKDLLGRMIAWRIQERFYGGHEKAAIMLLDGLARGEARKIEAGPRLKPGTVLMCEQRGVRHTVTAVVSDGFVWQERTPRSNRLTEPGDTSAARARSVSRQPCRPDRLDTLEQTQSTSDCQRLWHREIRRAMPAHAPELGQTVSQGARQMPANFARRGSSAHYDPFH
jgi:hypothetical protein